MRAFITAGVKFGVSLVLMLALASVVVPAVAAQEAATPVANPIGDAATGPAAVAIDCAPDAAAGQTNCTFLSSTGGVFTVPASVVCAPVAAVTVGAADENGYTGTGQVSLTLQGVVSTGGAATYTISIDGMGQSVAGPGLVCTGGDAEAENADNGTESSVDTGAGDASDNGSTEQPAELADQGDLPVTDENPSGTPEADGASVGNENNQASAPSTDGTEGAEFTTAEGSVAVEAADENVDPIDVVATVYNCASDPGGDDPATFADCSPAQGITVTATQDGTALPSVFTGATGSATISSVAGSALVLTEDQTSLPTGYVPLGNGVQIIDPVAAGVTATFVNIAATGTGHLQIVSGTCPTSGDARTEFRIIGARTFGAAETSCTPTPGATFTLSGGNLGPAGLVVTTGDDASWRGFLPAGNYTVSDDAASSEPFDVVEDSITAVIAIDYVPMPRGSLVVTRELCTEGEQEGTTITVSDTPQTGGPGCGANDSDFRVANAGDGTSGPSQDFTLGPDGSAQMDLTAGSYLLTDLASGQQTTVAIAEGGTTVANVRQIVLTGRAIVRSYDCADPASNDADPSDPSYFTENCTQPLGGATLTLLDSGANEVSTDTASGGGIITWSGLVPGAYSITSDSANCAIFAEGSDARAGFTVTVGETTMINVYRCAAPAIDGGNPEAEAPGGGTGEVPTGDGTSGGGNTGGFDGASTDPNGNTASGGAASTGDELKNVTQLPNTGIGNLSGSSSGQLFGALLTLLALAGVRLAASKRRAFSLR